ncbi:MAG: hypothetical protein WCY09_08800 [Candidatus Omnitrophota bacterium]|jgi:hypothetical protein
MAKSKKQSIKIPIGCPKFNELLRICSLLGRPCEAIDSNKCDLRGDNAQITTPKTTNKDRQIPTNNTCAKIASKDISSHPKYFTIEEQLKELGVEPSVIEMAIDANKIQAEVLDINIKSQDEIDAIYNSRYEKIKREIALCGDMIQVAERSRCCKCNGFYYYRYKYNNKWSAWICRTCYPYIENRVTIYPNDSPVTIEIKPPPFMPNGIRGFEDF